MALASGTRLGPYEIVTQIGAGGMGEVYRARDTRLDRTIAIKVLPEHLASDPQRLARFQREAETLSSLNHPHICALHDVGDEGGTRFLVMEYVEGETLDQRLTRGPVPIDDALTYAKQIADALEKAHQQGIIHRDLKPANVMITKSGVKLLDFGLARLAGKSDSGSPLTEMPTQGDSELTAEGTILGTFRYMAPEQVEGLEADARTDIYALCLVIYEMITGRQAVEGRSQASLIAAILKDRPRPITELQPVTPPQLDRVVQTGLEKDPDKRWQSAREVRHALEWIALEARPVLPASGRSHGSPLLAASLTGLGVGAALLLVWLLWPVAETPEMRVDIATLPTVDPTSFALSPDGRTIAFVGEANGEDQLWLREFGAGSDTPRPLAGTQDAAMPFWSPDGASLGFFADSQLKTIDLAGGSPRVLARIVFPGGGTWGDGVILFYPGGGDTILRIGEQGGQTVPAVSDPEVFNLAPRFLPDGERFLFFNGGAGAASRGIYVGSIDGADTEYLLDAESPGAFHPAGYLLYIRQGTLWAQPFDATSGDLGDGVQRVADGVSWASVSASGTIAYRRSAPAAAGELRWFDRTGEPLELFAPAFGAPVISEDGRLVAAQREGDIWVMAADLSQPRRVTFDARPDSFPVFSPDGSRIAFAAFREVVEIHAVASTGAASETTVLSDGGAPVDWLSDDQGILYADVSGPNVDLRSVQVSPAGRVTDYLADPETVETRGQVSPNGRWIAYELESASSLRQTEIFVRPFPEVSSGGLWQVSTDGGRYVRWSRDGTQLYYLSPGGALMAVSVDAAGPVFDFETAQPLFQTRIPPDVLNNSIVTPYDVSPDGRFLMVVAGSERNNTPITVILNWHPDTN